MDIEKGTTHTILYGGRSLLTPSYFLLRWTQKLTGTNTSVTYCIVENTGNTQGPILLEFLETGTSTADPFDAEVQLPVGDNFLEVWEQTSDTNLFPPDTDPAYSELTRVYGAQATPPPPVDPCLGCEGVTCPDATVEINGVEVVTVEAGDTVDIPVLQNGSPVGSWNGTQWIIPACPSGSTGNYWRAIALGT